MSITLTLENVDFGVVPLPPEHGGCALMLRDKESGIVVSAPFAESAVVTLIAQLQTRGRIQVAQHAPPPPPTNNDRRDR